MDIVTRFAEKYNMDRQSAKAYLFPYLYSEGGQEKIEEMLRG